ncbi:MAG: DUF4349 domain-containing protein, partial [Proteobacteria bacterium]|nr:DUF4349 domain-containing protein [Pseudomonadota bacterium]
MIGYLLMGLSLIGNAWADDEPAKRTEATEIHASIVLKVSNRDEAADDLVAKADEMGGFFSRHTSQELALRVPVADVEALIESAAERGLVTDRSFEATDLGGELLDLRSRLGAREKVLGQFFDLMPTAGPKSVLTVEREIAHLVAEIEQIKGRIRYLEDRAELAELVINFQFRERAAPSRDGNSSFAWLNTLNLADLIADFRSGWDDDGVKNSVAITPAGFSPFKDIKRQHWAVSPDEVLFRIRTEKHEPEADLEFWKEAVTVRMTEAGYGALRDQEIKANGTLGFFLEVTAPMGTQDYVYGIAAFPVGSRLVVAEAGGE